MASEIKANQISPATGTAFTLGDSGDTFTIPSGVTLTNNGTASGFGANTPFASVYISADQSISGTTTTLVNFDSEYVDTNGAFDTSTYRFTVPTGEGGNYMISTHVQCAFTTGSRILVYVYKNGSMLMRNRSLTRGGASHAGASMAAVHPLVAGDYLEVYANGDGSGVSVTGTAGFSIFSVFKLVE